MTVILIHSYPYPTVIPMKNGDVYLIHIYNKILFLSYKGNYNINHILINNTKYFILYILYYNIKQIASG